jgi:starch-binding outer membrane protein, SusD/RagB family
MDKAKILILKYMKSQILVLSIFIFLFTSCEKFLHEEEISVGLIASYDQLEIAAGGVYGMLNETFFGEDYYSFYSVNLKGDDLAPKTGGYYASWNKRLECISKGDFVYEDTSFNIYYLWQRLFQTIASANNIINQYDLAATDDKEIRAILGEIYLLRAYCYFRLTRTYGQIPVVDDIDIDYDLPKPTFEEIYQFIESDLKTAIKLLPENNASARIPFYTPHRGSAKAILAEVYLSWAGYPCKDESKYVLAAKESGEVIDSAAFFGFELMPDFAWIWDQPHFNNGESIFSLYTTNSSSSDLLETWGNIYYGYYGEFINRITEVWYLTPEFKINTFFPSTETSFFNRFPPGYRKDITFYNAIYVPSYMAREERGYIHIEKVDDCDRIAYRKFYYDAVQKDIQGEYGQLINLYIGTTRAYLFRYAHTILTYAEAMSRSGQPDTKAYECVNQIRRRARQLDLNSPSVYDLQPGLSSGAFADSVVWERAWELAGEPEGRWFDIVRLEMVEGLPNLRDPNEGGPPAIFDKSAYFFPIPEGDIILNPNLGK